MTLEAIVRDLRPRKMEPLSVIVVWSGTLQRQGKAPSLCDWNATGYNGYGSDSLSRAQGMGLRGIDPRL